MSQMCDLRNPVGVNAPTNLGNKTKKVHSATHVLRLILRSAVILAYAFSA